MLTLALIVIRSEVGFGKIESISIDSNVIDYINPSSVGNATDFGDLTQTRRSAAKASSPTRGIIAGGYDTPANFNIMDYIEIATTGNAVDFGDLTVVSNAAAGFSGS